MVSVSDSFHSGRDATLVNKESTLEFENLCKDISHVKCLVCRRISLMLKVNTSGVCTFCQNKKNHLSSGSYSLPVWYDDNNQVHYL